MLFTPGLYRVNLHFNHLQPFGSVALPLPKQAIFVDELLTSSCNVSPDEVRRIGSGWIFGRGKRASRLQLRPVALTAPKGKK
jgi:hypothetical protein